MMRRVNFLLILLLCTAVDSMCQESSVIKAICNLTGMTMEEMDPLEAEKLEDISSSPLHINSMSVSELKETGIFTHYQAVSLKDYILRHGAVMSVAELAMVDGFGEGFARRLSPFISFDNESCLANPYLASEEFHTDIALRSGIRLREKQETPEVNYGMRCKMSSNKRFEGGLAVNRSYSSESMKPDALSGNLVWHPDCLDGQIVIGDFNARFGQGLALWNGMSIGGTLSPDTFLRRTSGISPSSSFTGNYSFHGIAGDVTFRRLAISSMLSACRKDNAVVVTPGFNLTWLGKQGQIALTHYADISGMMQDIGIPDMKSSIDFACCLSGIDAFGELAYDWVFNTVAFIVGTTFPAGERFRAAYMLRYYPSRYSSSKSSAARSGTKCSNEYGASMSVAFKQNGNVSVDGKLGIDASYYPISKVLGNKSVQIKFDTSWEFKPMDTFSCSLRLTERIRSWGNPFRSELRIDLDYTPGEYLLSMRLDALMCVKPSALAYIEGGYLAKKLRLYLRQGFFHVDNWDDRIYSYERDLPGSFSVPAYYGRGLWTALNMSWHIADWIKLYIRAAVTDYVLMKEFKPGKAELELQFVFDF